ncbi:MAG: GIY-YIG nuclease family protein [Cecembia sp.]
MTYSVYIIESQSDGTFYIGVSSDPEMRLAKQDLWQMAFALRKCPWSK